MNNPTVPLGNIVANINVDAPRMFFPFDEVMAFGAEHVTLKSFIRCEMGASDPREASPAHTV